MHHEVMLSSTLLILSELMKRLLLLVLLAASFAYQACKNDIDLLDDYKESIVCYGVLNPKDTAHYLRIGKVFLGEGNALVMAQTSDSIQLRPEEMEVRITRLLNGTEMGFWILEPDSSIPRVPGVFEYPRQILYRGLFPVLTDGSTYLLTVTNLRTGFQAHSETVIVKDVVMTSPGSTQQALNFENETQIAFNFTAPRFGKGYHLALRFYYTEQFVYDTTQVATKYVDWVIGTTESLRDQGGESMGFLVRRDDFIRMLASQIPYNPLVRRIAGTLTFIYTSVADDYITYMRVQDANNNSAADLPVYSNIENGLGLFTSRNISTFPGYRLDQDTKYVLTTSPLLEDQNFIR
jgi:hypothetical protein